MVQTMAGGWSVKSQWFILLVFFWITMAIAAVSYMLKVYRNVGLI